MLAALRDSDDGRMPLELMCQACVRLVPVDGASVSMTSGSVYREVVYSTDKVSAHVEAVQFSLGEGPGFEAFGTGRAVLVPDLLSAATSTWPMFAKAVAELPVGALFAFPLQYGAVSIGTLSLYRRQPGWLSNADLTIALEAVDAVTVALLNLRTGVVNGEQWAALPRGREEVHQATGMLIAALGVPADQALARLRGYAFATGRLIDEVAHDIVTRDLHPRELDR